MTWIDRLLEQYGKLRIAGEAKDLEDNRAILKLDRASVRAHQRRTFGEDIQAGEDNADMIHIGDHHASIVQRPAAGGLVRWVIGLLGLAVGLGVGAASAGWWLPELRDASQGLDSSPPKGGQNLQIETKPLPAVEAKKREQRTDRDTLFELRLGPPSNVQNRPGNN